MKKLKFYDVKSKKSFESEEYEIREIKGRKFAVAETPEGNEAFRILPKDFEQ